MNYYAAIDQSNRVTHVWTSELDAGHPDVQSKGRQHGRWVYVEESCVVGDYLDVDSDGCATVIPSI
jgi:hypothetical protein